ncbi:hypothetical protein RRG08_000451 [Elysia crispata]|uniref:Amino acid transporter n=1 Tax=Elysia crispata TaxID=231223 RepID=A0AAE0YCK0_9GAST|nr:hypothetical protein RRG08_000451 [Elysia crispata]
MNIRFQEEVVFFVEIDLEPGPPFSVDLDKTLCSLSRCDLFSIPAGTLVMDLSVVALDVSHSWALPLIVTLSPQVCLAQHKTMIKAIKLLKPLPTSDFVAMESSLDNGHRLTVKTEKPKSSNKFRLFIMDNLFLVSNIVCIIAGFIIGLLVRWAGLGEDGILWLGLPGELYMRILKCIITPLIVCSVIDGTSSTDPRTNGKLGLVSLAYMIISNSIGAILGLVMCVLFRPGSGVRDDDTNSDLDTRSLTTTDIAADFIRNVFPPNMVGAALQVSQTQYKTKEVVNLVNISGYLVNQTTNVITRSVGTVGSPNILGLIVVSASLGIAASQSGDHGKPFLAFFKAGAHIIFKLFSWIKWTTPLGSASLIAASIAGLDKLGPGFRSMGLFSLLFAIVNFGIIQLVGLSAVFFLVQGRNPVTFFTQSARAWFMTFGSINSTIPYPEYVRVGKHFEVDPRVTEYILPLSCTLHKCGSACFVTAACVFVTQCTGIGTDLGTTLTIGILGLLASLALPSVNSASVVAIAIILDSLSVPSSGSLGLIMAMEWLNDRIRATTNAMSHLMCVFTTWRFCKKGFLPVSDGSEPNVETSKP